MKALICPHCDSKVSETAHVCAGCGAEIVRGATRRERSLAGVVFVFGAILVALVVSRAVELGRGSLSLPDPRSDSALLYFFCLLAMVALSYMIGKGVARLFRRSQVRFFRSYRHR